MTLLETAAHAADQSGAIGVGLIMLGALLLLLLITVLFGSGRPHTISPR